LFVDGAELANSKLKTKSEPFRTDRPLRVPTICLENLNDDEVRAYILADNRLAEKAGWDNSILAIELQHLTSVDLDFDVSITGFEIGEIDLILEEAAAEEEEEEPVEIRSGPAVTKGAFREDFNELRREFASVQTVWRRGGDSNPLSVLITRNLLISDTA
jgi:hypothetical protein